MCLSVSFLTSGLEENGQSIAILRQMKLLFKIRNKAVNKDKRISVLNFQMASYYHGHFCFCFFIFLSLFAFLLFLFYFTEFYLLIYFIF